MDTISSDRRSKNMRQIRSKDTKPEIAVRKLIHSMGYRYRLHSRNLPGKPDMVFSGRRKVIFVHGCFWHQHKSCISGRIPKSRVDYWRPKLTKNRKRDKTNQKRLKDFGWDCLVIWECEIQDTKKIAKLVRSFLNEKKSK